MAKENKDLHFLVLKQLKRSNLKEEDVLPNKKEEWRSFLSHVSHAYFDEEQGRYLLERSMEISSREMMELNGREALRHKLSNVLAENYSLQNAAPDLLKIICETFKFEIGELWALDKVNNVLRNITIWAADRSAMREFIEGTQHSSLSPNEGIPGRVWMQKKMYWIEDVMKDPHFSRHNLALKAGLNIHSALAFPIVFNNEVLGVLNFLSTSSLSTNSEMMSLLQDIERQIGIFISREQAQIQVAALSRQAGMSEVATSVLHNIGNIMNSAHVSISLSLETIKNSYVGKLIEISEIIKKHIALQDAYLTKHPQGKLIPDYLIELSKTISEEYSKVSDEIKNVDIHLNHIKDIVALQKDLSGIVDVRENIALPEIVDLAVQMGFSSIGSKKIQLKKNYECSKTILSEKAKLLQIIVNLITNAKEAVTAMQDEYKEIVVSTRYSPNKHYVQIVVRDNGVGISTENLTKIFSFGFTTKPKGHGFGLHVSSIAANQLGGRLMAQSEGINKGATFILELPLRKK